MNPYSWNSPRVYNDYRASQLSSRRSDLAREIYPKTGLEAPNEERKQQDDRETG